MSEPIDAAPPAAPIAPVDEPGLSPQLLPFAFARRFGVAITPDAPDSQGRLRVVYRVQPNLRVLAELTRYSGRRYGRGRRRGVYRFTHLGLSCARRKCSKRLRPNL